VLWTRKKEEGRKKISIQAAGEFPGPMEISLKGWGRKCASQSVALWIISEDLSKQYRNKL